MDMDDYQREARKTAVWREAGRQLLPDALHGLPAPAYCALGLAGEVGEIANKIKKYYRDEQLDYNAVKTELGDALWYLTMLADELVMTLGDIAEANLAKLASRQQRGTIGGQGDER